MKMIDFHCHAFPDNIVSKAVNNIGGYYGIPMQEDGKLPTLYATLEARPELSVVLLATATAAKQVYSINTWLSGIVSDRIFGYASIHPDYEDCAGEIDRAITLGFKGLKIHPEFQNFAIDDPAAYKIYEAAEGRLPILFHMGDDKSDFSSPARLKKVITDFPKLTVIGAHFGGYREWDESMRLLCDSDIYMDTSSSLEYITPEYARDFIRAHGADKFLFATDFPMWSFEPELERFNRIDLTDDEREMIFHRNAEKLLGITR